MAARPHVIVIHRWLARYAEYADYIDHDTYAVSYVTTEVGAPAVPATASDVAVVDATDDLPSVAERIKHLAEAHGRPAFIVALKEDDLLVAAQLRAEWNCPGPTVADVMPFRDKLLMVRAVSDAGLAVPAFAPVEGPADVVAFATRHGWPVIVKPRVGSSSAGVSKLDSAADCAGVDFESDDAMLAQAFDPRQIYHVDGYFDGTVIGPLRASRYVNTCLGFRTGEVLGSVEEDNPATVAAIRGFSDRALAALSAKPVVFHLELFVEDGSCAFLEVGARVGGAEIPFLWREVHGYDLMGAGFRLAMGVAAPPWPSRLDAGADPVERAETAGWLLAPAPARRPCVIEEATSMVGRTPGPYAEALLAPGQILPTADAYYEHVGGRFRFRGETAVEVETAIHTTARDFRVR